MVELIDHRHPDPLLELGKVHNHPIEGMTGFIANSTRNRNIQMISMPVNMPAFARIVFQGMGRIEGEQFGK